MKAREERGEEGRDIKCIVNFPPHAWHKGLQLNIDTSGQRGSDSLACISLRALHLSQRHMEKFDRLTVAP